MFQYGKLALESVMKTVCGFETPFVSLPEYNKGDFFRDCQQAFVGVGLIVKEQGVVPILDKGELALRCYTNTLSTYLLNLTHFARYQNRPPINILSLNVAQHLLFMY